MFFSAASTEARFAWLPASLAFHWPSLRHLERQTFGDVRKKMPYEDVKQMDSGMEI